MVIHFLQDTVFSYIYSREPKGGGGGGGRGGGSSSGGKASYGGGGGTGGVGGGGSSGHIPVWPFIVAATWLWCLLSMWGFFHRGDKAKNPGRPRRALRSFGYALQFVLLITPVIWTFKKTRSLFRKDKGSGKQLEEDRARLVSDHNEATGHTGEEKYSSRVPSPITSRDPSPDRSLSPQPPPPVSLLATVR